MEIKIERLDDLGRGIGYVDGIITFVPSTIPGDIVDAKITKQHKKYKEAEVVRYLKFSEQRIPAPCPFFADCGGCTLQPLTYEDTIKYKVVKVKNLFLKKGVSIDPQVIINPKPYNYRNKISLKVINGKIGFYQVMSNNLVNITECLISDKALNKCLKLLSSFNIKNGNIVIRCNQKGEILIIITSKDQLNIASDFFKKYLNLRGIIINNKLVYGADYFMEEINGIQYKVSYDAFFQVNPYVASQLFAVVKNNINPGDKVVDLYSGVGTLSLNAALVAERVFGIEIVENAVKDAQYNALINDISNVTFLLGDASKLPNLNINFNKLIVDPPRSGLSKELVETILDVKPKNIIYVSCDPATLVRDYKLLEEAYAIKKSYVLDMFSYTYHVETILILERYVK